MTWTRFMDMHSGGGLKEAPYEHILIQAPEGEARAIFYNRFGHNPERVTCTCCGEDYSISEEEDIAQITAYDRNCAYVYFDAETDEELGVRDELEDLEFDRELKEWTYKGRRTTPRYVERPELRNMKYGATKKSCVERYKTLEEYLALETVLVIESEDIRDEERTAEIPAQGYVWVD